MLRAFAKCVGRLSVGRLAQSALGALDSLFKRELLGIVEFFLAGLCLPEELERPIILLIAQVIEAVT
jgi:hypothetical protein